RLVWHYGHWGTGFSTMYLKVPARRLTLVLLSNSEALADHHYQVGEDITNDVFACSFLQAFVPEVANGAEVTRSTQDTQGSPSDARSGGAGREGRAKDCERSSQTARAKGIEDRRSRGRQAITLDRELLEAYAGRYQFPHRVLTVSLDGNR